VYHKRFLEYKSPYMSKNVCPNMVMIILQDLIETRLYKYLNVTIHHQWRSLFSLHLNSKLKLKIMIIHASNNSNFESEKTFIH
jgi:hypothetical protein